MKITENTLLKSGFFNYEKRRSKIIKNLNYCTIIIYLLHILFFTVIDFKQLYPSIINLAASIIPLIISLNLNKRGKRNAAGYFLGYSLVLTLFISVFITEKKPSFHYYFLLYAIIPLLLVSLQKRWFILLLSLISIVCFLYIEFIHSEQYVIIQFSEKYIPYIRGSILIISFVLIGIVFLTYKIITENNEAILQEQSKKLVAQKKELTRINNELTNLIVTKDKFFSIIAHDLKNPLSGLMEISELLYINQDKYDESTINKMLALLYESSKSSFNLLENLLTWSRMQTGSIKPIQKKLIYIRLLTKQVIHLKICVKKRIFS